MFCNLKYPGHVKIKIMILGEYVKLFNLAGHQIMAWGIIASLHH